jgi:hypothetical protein
MDLTKKIQRRHSKTERNEKASQGLFDGSLVHDERQEELGYISNWGLFNEKIFKETNLTVPLYLSWIPVAFFFIHFILCYVDWVLRVDYTPFTLLTYIIANSVFAAATLILIVIGTGVYYCCGSNQYALAFQNAIAQSWLKDEGGETAPMNKTKPPAWQIHSVKVTAFQTFHRTRARLFLWTLFSFFLFMLFLGNAIYIQNWLNKYSPTTPSPNRFHGSSFPEVPSLYILNIQYFGMTLFQGISSLVMLLLYFFMVFQRA